MSEYTSMLATAFGQCLTWFAEILSGSGMAGVYLGCLVAYMTYKFLLAPVFGVHQSDTARKVAYKAKKEDKD